MIPGERFDTYRYTVTMMGGYHQFGEFLANVGSLARIVAPVSFSVTSSSGNAAPRSAAQSSEKGGLASTITLQTYVEKTSPAKPAVKERSS
jgi:type IV pilus assembly protein PilO